MLYYSRFRHHSRGTEGRPRRGPPSQFQARLGLGMIDSETVLTLANMPPLTVIQAVRRGVAAAA